MNAPIFLSFPKPHMQRQHDFIGKIKQHLLDRGMEPRTLGVTDYDMEAPLRSIRQLLLESNGLLTVAFRRYFVREGAEREDADVPDMEPRSISGYWFTSPYCQIEPAMAYQLGLPVLVLRERGVHADGLLERGVLGTYMPEFDCNKSLDEYFRHPSWTQIMGVWEGYVRAVRKSKGNPPQLY